MTTYNDLLESYVTRLTEAPRHPFAALERSCIPPIAAGVYAISTRDRSLLYVGMAGRGKTSEDLAAAIRPTGLANRLRSHLNGRRSGDQFAVYVADHTILPTLTPDVVNGIASGDVALDDLVSEHVRRNLWFQYVVTPDGATATALERHLHRSWSPTWNNPARRRQATS